MKNQHRLLIAPILFGFAAAAHAVADLTIKDIKLDKDCKIHVLAANLGSGVPASFYNLPKAVSVQMWKDGKPWGGLILSGFDPAGKLKHPHSSTDHIWFPNAANLNLKPGSHILKVMIDKDNVLKESNENNNVIVKKVTCAGKLPDLTVRDIKLLPNCGIQVTVANIGAGGVPAFNYILPHAVAVQMYNNDKPWGGLILSGFDPAGKLKVAGGVATHTWFPGAKNLLLGEGAHKIKVVVDSNSKMTEVSEANNTRTEVLKCKK